MIVAREWERVRRTLARVALIGLASLGALPAAGCDAERARLAPSATANDAKSAAPGTSPRAQFSAHVFPEQKRVVAFGDVHGDLDATKRALKLGGAIDDGGHWNGGELFVVQVGDQLDRGDDDRAILDYFEQLREEAAKAGGTFLSLNGNHELMNVSFDFRYTTEGANRAFEDVPVPAGLASHPAATRGRAAAFAPGGLYAQKLAKQPLYAVVGGSVFAHGGILKKHLDYGLDKMDAEVRDWLLGKRPEGPPVVLAEDGVVWTRAFSAQTGDSDCASLSEVLKMMQAQRLVMGHTPQRAGVSLVCDGKAVRIDTGLARYYQGPIEVIEIVDNQAKVLREKP